VADHSTLTSDLGLQRPDFADGLRHLRTVLVVLAMAALSACGGGGGGGGGAPANQPPVASFTVSPTSGDAPLTVTFDAAASSDPDGSITSYDWAFGDGGASTGVTTSHVFAAAGTFTVTLTVRDDDGAAGAATRNVTVSGGTPSNVAVNGRVTFERVPFASDPDSTLAVGLNYAATFQVPARRIEVDLLRASDRSVLTTTLTDADGRYAVSAPSSTDVIVRAKALSRVTGTGADPASWDLRVVNNTNGNALYVLDSGSFSTGTTDVTRNLVATTGWGGFAGTYTGVRAAAPFAVLDTLYSAVQFVIGSGDATIDLPELVAYWSPQNRPSDSFDPAAGNILTTQYWSANSSGTPPGIYVLGAADNDTDEFDQHVMAHEFQHYLEEALSRTDSVGGSHGLDERLDMRVAFSEGFANAFSAMVLDDPLYRDSFGARQASGFGFDVESGGASVPGWYNEASVHRIAWDLYDAGNDAADSDAVTIGFGPMLDVFRDELRDGVPLTSLFSFITALKQRPGVPAAAVDARVEAEGVPGSAYGIVSQTMDAYATTETHSSVAPASEDVVLPVYSAITPNGPAVTVCGDTALTQPDATVISGNYNGLGNRRFLRFTVPSARTIDVQVSCVSTDPTCLGSPQPDPDMVLTQGRSTWISESETPFTERLQAPVNAGEAVLEVYEYSHVDPQATTRRGRTCLTVTITG
jgi:PKD repeat protein